MTEFRRVPLRTGVTLNVALAGDEQKPAAVLLHGFPESHRTWRQVAPGLEDDFFLIMPDQRGFAGSDRPQDVEAYRTELLVDDIFALADALTIERFSLVGHDWGGSIAWIAAAKGDPRLERLAIINAPHWAVFQKSLIEHEEQRQASQYITMLRNPSAEQSIEAMGLGTFFEKVIGSNADLGRISEREKQQYITDWSQPGALRAMLNWYRASPLVVPPPGISVPVPDALLHLAKSIHIPTLVIWGMADSALLPVQLEGLDAVVDDLAIVRLPGIRHFAPWEAAERVVAALRPFLAGQAGASARS
ncbi:MAG TPA: alpha/beta hydrolase [Sphingomicrobium sp.]|nr:alpha/beta hydrolase [Sphingomicrobium sp.]